MFQSFEVQASQPKKVDSHADSGMSADHDAIGHLSRLFGNWAQLVVGDKFL